MSESPMAPPAGARRPHGPSRPVSLRKRAGALVDLRAELGAGRRAELPLGALGRLKLQLHGVDEARQPPKQHPVFMQSIGGRVALAPAPALIRVLTGIDLPDDPNHPLHAMGLSIALQSLPPAWFRLFAASCVLDLADEPPGPLEARLSIAPADGAWGLAFTVRGTASALRCALANGAWPSVAVPNCPLPQTWKLDTPLCAGRVTLPRSTVRSLEPGDVVLMDAPDFAPDGRVLLRVGRIAIVGCLEPWNPGELEVTDVRHIPGGTPMDEPAIDTPLHALNPADGVASLDDVPIALSFDLGTVEMTLAELQQLTPGQVI